MLFVDLPKLCDTMFDVDGYKIGHGVFLDQIEEHANNQLQIMNFNNKLVKAFSKKIREYTPTPHEHSECCGCGLTDKGKIEFEVLKSILDSVSQQSIKKGMEQ